MKYIIDFNWDDEAQVWVATSNDVPGLVLESGSFDALMERVKVAVPELLEFNHISGVEALIYRTERQQRLIG